MTAYDEVLATLASVPWSLAPEVTPIWPVGRSNIEFFLGTASSMDFPVGGVMVVGNNFSSLDGWRTYAEGPDLESSTRTWRNLRLMIASSGVPTEKFWFTNYCYGVMDRGAESYDFPARVIERLQFDRVFAETVRAMKPMVVVSLGRLASRFVGTDYAARKNVDTRTILAHSTKLMATVHPLMDLVQRSRQARFPVAKVNVSARSTLTRSCKIAATRTDRDVAEALGARFRSRFGGRLERHDAILLPEARPHSRRRRRCREMK